MIKTLRYMMLGAVLVMAGTSCSAVSYTHLTLPTKA